MTLLIALVLLHGTVTIGPVTPVCKVGTPCAKPAARVTLTFTRPGRTVKTVTNASGRYRVSLPAGTWTVRSNAGMRITPARFVVPRSTSVLRNFAIDTGIR